MTVTPHHEMSVDEFEQMATTSPALLQQYGSYSLDPREFPYPPDPFGPAYESAVLDHWKRLSGQASYGAAEHESFSLDQDYFLPRPYPFNTGDGREISNYLHGVANIVRLVDDVVPRGSRIVEFGSGWGHAAMALAQSGHSVTAVDLNPDSIALLRRRAAALNVPLDVVQGEFLGVEFEPASVDVVLFFEAFHHCLRPWELLDRCRRMLAPNGVLLLVAEPIYPWFPSPWGIRLDGQSVFMARENGWLELGFERSFFLRALLRRGFAPAEGRGAAGDAYAPYVIAFTGENFTPGRLSLPDDEQATWHRAENESGEAWTTASSRITVPAAERIELVLVNHRARRQQVVISADGVRRHREKVDRGAETSISIPWFDRPAVLQIDTDGWVPRDEGIGHDEREVGVFVRSLRVVRGAAPPVR